MTRPPSPEAVLVSVILPVRDRAASIGRAIASVLTQDYRPFEIIVIDDGSTDATRDVVKGFGDAVQLIAQPPASAYGARNAGVRAARGALIAFIDSDDAWLPGKLSAQVALFADPAVGLVFGDVVHVSAAEVGAPRTGRTSFSVAPPPRAGESQVGGFAERNYVPTSTVLVRRECLTEIGGFSEARPRSADYLAWFRIAQRHALAWLPDPVAEYTVHAAGISFDLGTSLVDRIALFEAERAIAGPAVRPVLDRLLANLAVSLVVAKLRGRARSVSVSPAWRLLSARFPFAIGADLWRFATTRAATRLRTRA
ncbi:MAG: glycosyltransferase [Pseudomonadota bacterium]